LEDAEAVVQGVGEDMDVGLVPGDELPIHPDSFDLIDHDFSSSAREPGWASRCCGAWERAGAAGGPRAKARRVVARRGSGVRAPRRAHPDGGDEGLEEAADLRGVADPVLEEDLGGGQAVPFT